MADEGINTKKPDKAALKKIKADDEKGFLKEIKKKNKGFLVEMDLLERERVAKFVLDRIQEGMPKHDELVKKIEEYDEIWRMERKQVIGADAEMPNYRSPLTTVALEVMHATIMNVFFSPKQIANALPTEEGDIGKIKKLDTFMNWSVENELKIFENVDRLFHNSDKVGEAPYMVHWVKEYGTEIRREIVFDDETGEPVIDEDTQRPVFKEEEVQKLLYNAPKMEVFSRRDYIQPENALMDKLPEWEARRIRLTYDMYLRDQLQGKMYPDTIQEISGWGRGKQMSGEQGVQDFEGDEIPIGNWEQEFFEWYGRIRLTLIKQDKESDTIEREEIEDEFIAIVHKSSKVLCSFRRNPYSSS